jgi:hypothetical protein
MFAPAVVALLIYLVLEVAGTRSFDRVIGQHTPTPLAWTWLVLTAVSCYAACSWLTGRFTQRRWMRLLVGLFLGAGIFLCNVIIAFFGGCTVFGMQF